MTLPLAPPIALLLGLALAASGSLPDARASGRRRSGLWILCVAFASFGLGAGGYWLFGAGFSELGGPPVDVGKWPGVVLWAGWMFPLGALATPPAARLVVARGWLQG